MREYYTDYCVEDNVENEIEIDYFHVPNLGTLTENYKKGDFHCEKKDNGECEYYNRTNHCSVHEKAPITK